ncbi:MucR family transcriptional regulator [Novosphingobium sp. HII-3]|uniref:MucR family transcriptional regulator n=1 Tax=Novosphingobium sp. HII-3 TaxID=2075565 RepID=UPI000CDAA005|nr:MucR family transcriptional regulator [Novosphingobium sp. HII-3]
MPDVEPTNDVAALTVQLLSVYLANNTVASEDLAGLIRSTKDALGEQGENPQLEPEVATPAVSVRKSLASPDHILSLIDGKPYKTLKRHLMSHGLTPDAYRSRYGLPASYPMVAPTYAEHRRAVAQQTGLGVRKSIAKGSASSKEDQLDTEGLAHVEEPSLAQASASESEQQSAVGEQTGAAEEPATSSPDTAPAEANIPTDTTGSTTAENSKDDATTAPKKRARSAAGKRSAKAPTKDSGSSRGKAEAEAPESAEVATESSPAASSPAASSPAGEPSMPAKAPKRRSKLGLFKNSGAGEDALADGSGVEGTDATSQPQEGEGAGAASSARTPAKRKTPKRMARSADASASSAAPGGNEPTE